MEKNPCINISFFFHFFVVHICLILARNSKLFFCEIFSFEFFFSFLCAELGRTIKIVNVFVINMNNYYYVSIKCRKFIHKSQQQVVGFWGYFFLFFFSFYVHSQLFFRSMHRVCFYYKIHKFYFVATKNCCQQKIIMLKFNEIVFIIKLKKNMLLFLAIQGKKRQKCFSGYITEEFIYILNISIIKFY